MSINVTITGNPIKIQKGKMVTASHNTSPKDFEKRRLIRLSQVREQSKNIAEDVRNRVRRQKLKQAEMIEKSGQIKLKQWQARKLLELQTQYHEALRDIGTGHKEACSLEGEGNTAQEKVQNYNKIAKQRASVANKKLQEEKEKLNQNLLVAVQKKKLVRKMEDERAHLITGLRRSPKTSKKKKDENICIENDVSGIVTDSDSEYEDIEEIHNPETTNVEIDLFKSSESVPKSDVASDVNEEIPQKNALNNLEELNTADLANQDDQLLRELRDHKETRLSDRIRRRSLVRLEQPDCCNMYDPTCAAHERKQIHNDRNASSSTVRTVPVRTGSCNTLPNVQQNIYTCACNPLPHVVPIPSPCYCSQPSPRKQRFSISDINQLRCQEFTDEIDDRERQKFVQKPPSKPLINLVPPSSPKRPTRQKEIPTKPKVTLKSFRNTEKLHQEMTNKSQPSSCLQAHVEKINEHNLITSPIALTEMDFTEKMKQRDREALLRGQKALEREKLQREYNELLKKLPVLQKLERLYEMNQDKPEYHMTEERLREQERKKQSVLDNTYEKLFPDRQTKITIPVKNAAEYDMREKEKTLQVDDVATLNLGDWEAQKKSRKLYTEEEVQAILREGKFTSESKIRTDQLKSVLEKLRKQKDELLKEIQNLPEDSVKLSKMPSHFPELKRNINQKANTFLESSEKTNKHSEAETHHNSTINKKPGKFGRSTLQSGSSYETIDEPLKKHMKISKSVRSKGVQVTKNSRKSKNIVKSKIVSTASSKSSSPQKLVKRRRPEKEIFSSNEQSSTEQRNVKKSPKESTGPSTDQQTCKKQVEVVTIDHSVTPEVTKNASISMNKEITTPKNESSMPEKPFVNCECNKDPLPKIPEELCEIVIKIKDGKSSQVLIKENSEISKNSFKSTTNKQNIIKKTQKGEHTMPIQIQQDLHKAMNDDCCQKKDGTKSLSWHDKLTKNNSQVSNSSTSYMSPPRLPNKRVSQSRGPKTGTSISRKPQKPNLDEMISSPPTKLQGEHLNMQDEIKRLLTMSRLSVEELGVSSVSTVTTPSQSIIDLDSNKAYTYISENNGSTYSSMNGRSSQQVSDEQSQNHMPNFSYMSISTGSKTVIASEVDSTSEQYPDILTKYAKLADKCSQRISNLSAMIDKVREEKNRMLQTSSIITMNDSSTKYMDLPSPRKSVNEKESIEKNKSSSSSGSGEGSNLLDINLSLAEKLKGLSPEEIEKFGEVIDIANDSLNDIRTDDFDKRLRALREPVQVTNDSDKQLPRESEKGDSVDFVPLLLDIPKMPLLSSDSSNSKHRRPPPAKGFLAARRITDCMTPHELSTIPEQDSQVRLESTIKEKSPQIQAKEKRNLAQETIPTQKKITQLEGRKNTTQEKLVNGKDKTETVPDDSIQSVAKSNPTINHKRRTTKLAEVLNMSDNSLCSSNTSGDEKLEMFRIEAMLRSIGMDWAISTLRKTQETLALTSSSSSLDIKSPATIKELSEVNIKDFLAKQVFQKISSSTLRSDASPGSMDESHDLSEIKNGDFSKKQTSTPINRSRELLRTDEKTSDLPSAIESGKESKEFFSFVDHSA